MIGRSTSRFDIVLGIMVVSLTWTAMGRAQQTDVPSAGFRSGAGWPLPNVDLPAHVVAPKGKLSFFADFSRPAEKGYPIYLVNRTDKAIPVPVQDGSLRVALAVKMSEGVWQQAQVHEPSFCGNSYYSLVLPPGQHFKSFGYQPKAGMVGKVRYQFFRGMENLVSNEGAGYWDETDLAASLKSEVDITPLDRGLSALIEEVPARMEGGIWTKAENAMLWLDLVGRHRQDRVYSNGIGQVRRLIQTTRLQSQEQTMGLRRYVELENRDPGSGTIRLLKRAADLVKSGPTDEPNANAEARKNLAYSAGRELRLEEFFR